MDIGQASDAQHDYGMSKLKNQTTRFFITV